MIVMKHEGISTELFPICCFQGRYFSVLFFSFSFLRSILFFSNKHIPSLSKNVQLLHFQNNFINMNAFPVT